MAKQLINIGRTANDRSGDPLRTAFSKVNANFTELYTLVGAEGGGGVATVVSDTAPSDPVEGALWWNTVDGKLYVRYSSAWVDATTPSGSSTGDIGFTSSTMYDLTGLTISNRDLSHGATASVILPSNGDGDIQLQSLYGGVTIGTGANNAITNTWEFKDDGKLNLPGTGTINNLVGNATGAVYTIATDYQGNTPAISNVANIHITRDSNTSQITTGWIITFNNGLQKTVTSSFESSPPPGHQVLLWSGTVDLASGDVWPITVQSADYAAGSANLTISPNNITEWTFGADGNLTIPGNINSTKDNIAIGMNAGSAEVGSVSIGYNAGQTSQGNYSVAIGASAGKTSQTSNAVAIGNAAGYDTQGTLAIAIGSSAGQTNQSINSIAIGTQAGYTGQGELSIAIGNGAGYSNQPDRTIILNATGSNISGDADQTDRFYVKPVRQVSGGVAPSGFYPTYYNPTTGEFIVVTP